MDRSQILEHLPGLRETTEQFTIKCAAHLRNIAGKPLRPGADFNHQRFNLV